MTVTLLDTTEARRLTERIRVALDRVATGWADLAERVAEAYERRADLALGYDSWEKYASAELRPSEGIAAEVRRELVGLLSARGMSSRAIAPVAGVNDSRVRQIVRKVGSDYPPEPAERVNPVTGEIVPAPTFGAVDVTDWTNDEITEDLEACEAETAHWEETTVPAKITGLDDKTYTRPEPQPKETPVTTASRLAMPQPPKYGGNRLKHNRVIENIALAGRGMCTVLDEITELDQSITNEEAGRLASDLSEVIRSLKRVQTMLNRKATS